MTAMGLFDSLGNVFSGIGSSPLTQTGPTSPYGLQATAVNQAVTGANANIANTLAGAGTQAAGAAGTAAAPAYTNWATAQPGAQTLASALNPQNAGWWSNILQNTPGYQATLDQSLGAARRQAAAGGQDLSGGAVAAASRIGATQANQYWNQYLSQLAGQQQAAGQAAQTYAAPYTQLASVYGGLGQTGAQTQAALDPYNIAAQAAQYLGPAQASAQADYYNTQLGGNLVAGLLGLGSNAGFGGSVVGSLGKSLYGALTQPSTS
jgi:hypothetical protein